MGLEPSGIAAAAAADRVRMCRPRHTSMKQHTERSSLPGALGMHCALMSLCSGSVSLVVAFILWWRTLPSDIRHIGDQASLFSAALGLTLAGIAAASQRKRVRRVAALALVVNLAILCFTLDNMFTLIRW